LFAPIEPPSMPEIRQPPVRVVIVDDHQQFRQVASELLGRRGYAVVGEAGDAASALDAVKRLAPDGVLLDVRLGEDDGFEVALALSEVVPATAVVLTSCDDQRDCLARVRACRARGFVHKTRLAHIDLAQFWPRSRSG
jgi:DNA-binding NarL/FixJ family response regulator